MVLQEPALDQWGRDAVHAPQLAVLSSPDRRGKLAAIIVQRRQLLKQKNLDRLLCNKNAATCSAQLARQTVVVA